MNNANINIAVGPQPAQEQALHPSWTVKRGWIIVNLDKKQFVPFDIPPEVRYQTSYQHVNGRYQEVRHAVQDLDDRRPSPRKIMSVTHEYGEAIWPLSEPVLLPPDEVERYVQNNIVALPNKRGATEPAGLKIHELPYDVQVHIFDSIDNVADATKLCLSHPALLRAGYKRSVKLANERWASWAGDRLLGLPGQHDVQFWSDARRAPPDALSADHDLMADIEVAGGFIPYFKTFRRAERRSRCPHTIRDLVRQMPQYDWASSPSISFCHHPSEADYIVCNVTKREFARDVVTVGAKISEMPLRVGRTIPVRICYGSEEAGSWAGDRVLVRPLENARAGFEDWDRWKDVTKLDFPFTT
ncbi:hypothetical protein PsYK624_064370 [Phanerochaete sordida]|uniref:Uncharacterized protein n=1 Tax=Phanerochaete sordida TaxID=48140 RepID=A0A9P3G8L8_9APHY|nr:hypothetical protein PsYK624_064370 [Phanerochaete sordida]